MPVMPKMCKTCPFRDGTPYEHLRPMLTTSALTEGSRICHSTGSSGLLGNTGKPDRVCRGARDVQIRVMHALDVLDEPTDAEWERKVRLHCLGEKDV